MTPPRFTTMPPSGWQAAHVGFANDGLVLDELPVWDLPWRKEAAAPVMLTHPAYPNQMHQFEVYAIDDGSRATRFAATELSNGVWGFYRWIVPADAPEGESADGSLRYVHSLGELIGGRYDAVAPVASLRDAASGALVFDGAAWSSSRVVPQADGSLLLVLQQRDRESLFRIDPATRSFQDLAKHDSPRPLGELAAAADAAHGEFNDPANAYVSHRVAPDGSMLVELDWVEWSNSHWVRSPRVTETATGRVLLDLWGTDWDADVTFPRDRTVRLAFRRYHVGGALDAEIDLGENCYRIDEGPAGTSDGPIADMPSALETASHRAAAAAPPRPMIPAARTSLRSYGNALLILIGALIAIAAATFIVEHFKPRPAQHLDRIPPMPPDLRH